MTRIEELEHTIDETVEKFRLEINKFKAELEDIKELVEESKKEESKKEESKKDISGKWKPKVGEMYWFRGTDCDYLGCINKGTYDEWRIKHLPIFQTKEECKKYWKFRDAVKEKSYEFSREEWEDRYITKYSIHCILDEFRIDESQRYRDIGAIYFRNREDAQYIIGNYKEELMEYFL